MSLTITIPFARFFLGTLCLTPNADQALKASGASLAELLTRHARGDWGEICASDRAANEIALERGQRLLSSYILPDGQILWILTEADRSSTVVLLPEEY